MSDDRLKKGRWMDSIHGRARELRLGDLIAHEAQKGGQHWLTFAAVTVSGLRSTAQLIPRGPFRYSYEVEQAFREWCAEVAG